MPYVYRRQQPLSPLTAVNRTLIGWYDNSNIIYNGGETNSIADKSGLDNKVYLVNQATINTAIRKFTLENFSGYNRSSEINARYSPNGISFFFVGAPGYSTFGLQLLNIGFYNILSINFDNIIMINNTNTDKLIVNGNNIILISGSIDNTGASILYLNNTSPTAIFTNMAYGEISYPFFNIGGQQNTYNINTLSNINNNINDYLPDKGSNIYPNSLNSINEVLIYNNVLNSNEFQNINNYLINKWNILSPTIEDFQNISHLLCWYSITNSNTIRTATPSSNEVRAILDIGGLSNSIYSPGQPDGKLPTYSSNLIQFNSINTYYSTQLFTGTGFTNGLTVSMVLNADSFKEDSFNLDISNNYVDISNNYGVILSVSPANIEDNSSIPTIINDRLGNIIGTYTSYKNSYNINTDILSYRNIGNNSDDLYILTAQFDGLSSQIFINGLPMLKYEYDIVSSWNTSIALKINYGGSIIDNIKYACDISLGETIIYKKILNNTELNTVHLYLASKYNIPYNIEPQNYYLWFKPDNRTGRVDTVNLKHTSENIILSNTSSGYSVLRSLSGSQYIDFNNGSPSYLEANSTAEILSTLDSNFYVYIVSTVNTGAINEKGSLLYMEATNKSYINFEFIYNSNYPIFQITNYNSLMNTSNILSYKINNNILPTLFRIKIDNNSITSNLLSYGIPNTQYNTEIINIQSNSITSFSNINTIRIGSNCKNSIGDIIIYNRSLYQNEEVNILAYLQNKYTIPKQIIFPTDYLFWFDPRDISPGIPSAWIDKTRNFTLTYSDLARQPVSTSSPVVTTIGCNTYYSGDSEHFFYNIFNLYDITINSGVTYFIVCTSNNTSDIQNMFGISSSALSTSLQCDSDNLLYPTHYIDGSIDIEECETNYNALLETRIDSPYIACITYNGIIGNYTVTAKGSISETSTDREISIQDFSSGCIISIGGFAYNNSNGSGIKDNTFTGRIGDVIYYNRILSDSEKMSVIQYLEAKYYSSNGEPLNINIIPP